MIKQKITDEIKKFITDSEVKIITSDNKHFNAIIISDIFNGKEIIDRQKTIYDIIGKYIINGDIHALSFKTYTKSEWNDIN